MNRKTIKSTGNALGNGLLWIFEIICKITASVAAAITLGAGGGFFDKIGNGFYSLPQTLRQLYEMVNSSDYVSEVINDYNTLTAAAFNQKYGSGALNYVMQYLNEGVRYLQNIYQNISQEPITTLLATIIVFLILYLAGRSARFVRQRGQGSVIARMERKAGNKIFKSQSQEKEI